MVSTLEGRDLVNRVSVDGEFVFDEIIEAYGNKILKLCFVQLGNKEEAEDATQEVFIKVFKNIKSYNGDANIYTWIYKITINTCFDILKKKKKNSYDDISPYIEFYYICFILRN
ncbi:MAG: sigma-70 family RNA polymerase sigma factor [Clostridium sp.]|nr:sigma-70 family RNA polymerase sigma factor [Clostridium sp.]